MCASDLSAFGAMMTCQKRGLTIPDDIAIAGFGAYDISANALPEITTIDVGARGIGTQVAEVIKSSLADKTRSKDPANIDIPTRLIVRKSTAG
jgi:LacI family gluconate utilization system Gnt-I transcriptional repressor